MFASQEEFLERRPAYDRDWIDSGLRDVEGFRKLTGEMVAGDAERAGLLQAALALTVLLKTPEPQMVPALRLLLSQWMTA